MRVALVLAGVVASILLLARCGGGGGGAQPPTVVSTGTGPTSSPPSPSPSTPTVGAGVEFGEAAVSGQWTRVPNLPISPVHNVYLPSGRIMMVGRFFNQTLWDPATRSAGNLPNPGYDLFCAGHGLLPDGRVLLAGGHIADFVGLARASVYDPRTNSWTPAPDMNAGRWYPTVTALPNGDALVTSGSMDTSMGMNTLPQVYQPATNSWRNLTSAQLDQPMYPMMFVVPDGRVVDVGPGTTTRLLDTRGTGSWSFVAERNHGFRDYGTAAMYAPARSWWSGAAIRRRPRPRSSTCTRPTPGGAPSRRCPSSGATTPAPSCPTARCW